jgi:hypothetical protein
LTSQPRIGLFRQIFLTSVDNYFVTFFDKDGKGKNDLA